MTASWRLSPERALTLGEPRLIGILNVTPDSFSDGGRYSGVDEAVNAALQMAQEGACIIDVGGESTRPGAEPVEAAEQIRRTVPVIRAIRQREQIPKNSIAPVLVSIDTTSATVAQAALEAGADIINDISAGRDDEGMFRLAASRQCGLILMHRRSPPQSDQYSDRYKVALDYGGDVVDFVRCFLKERSDAAIAAGVSPQAIVIDPGLGFGKSVEQNYELIRGTGELMQLGFPVLSAASRKSFIGAASGETAPSQRIAGSLAVSVAHYLEGIRLFRVHDVRAHRQALAVASAIMEGESESHPFECGTVRC